MIRSIESLGLPAHEVQTIQRRARMLEQGAQLLNVIEQHGGSLPGNSKATNNHQALNQVLDSVVGTREQIARAGKADSAFYGMLTDLLETSENFRDDKTGEINATSINNAGEKHINKLPNQVDAIEKTQRDMLVQLFENPQAADRFIESIKIFNMAMKEDVSNTWNKFKGFGDTIDDMVKYDGLDPHGKLVRTWKACERSAKNGTVDQNLFNAFKEALGKHNTDWAATAYNKYANHSKDKQAFDARTSTASPQVKTEQNDTPNTKTTSEQPDNTADGIFSWGKAGLAAISALIGGIIASMMGGGAQPATIAAK